MNVQSRWQDIKRLFERSQALPENQRDAWLVDECGADAALLEEIRGLLSAQQSHAGIFEDGAMGVLRKLDSERAATDWIGRRIGPYRLQALLGEGGMGSVFLAERRSGEFVQRVALKIVRAEFGSVDAQRRFTREHNVLAKLVHPNIAQLHDGGVADDVSYITLEYVEGLPITAYCDAHRLGIRARLRLMMQVCAAIAYAHRNLVVHRDLKPSNILVTAGGEVKVLDFGIAKLLDADAGQGRTESQARLMTPEYAAPEQVLGDTITTATDVYAIGVLLFELLCGRRPYARADSGSISWAKAVVEEAPDSLFRALHREPGSKPHLTGEHAADNRATTLPALSRALRGDLDRIVQRALAKQPEARYASVRELADDLDAYVNGRAISGSSRRYRLRKFVRRHWLPIFVAAAVAVIVVASGTAIVWQARQTEQEAGKAATVKQFLLELFRNADPNVAQGHQISTRDIVDRGVQRVEKLPATQYELKAELQTVLGNIYYQLGLLKEAQALHERAFAALKDTPADATLAAEAERFEATELASLGDNARAQTLADDAVARLRSLPHRSAHDLAKALSTAGWIAKKRADIERSRRFSDEAFVLANEPPVDDEVLLLALRQRGEVRRLQNDFAAAADDYGKALAISVQRFGEDDEESIVLKRLLGTSFNQLGEFAKAQPYLEAAASASQRVFGDASGRTLRDEEMLAVNELDAGRMLDAKALLDRTLAVAERSTPRDDSVLTEIRLNLGEIDADLENAEVAEKRLIEVRDYLRQQGGDEGELAEALNGLGNAHLHLNKLDLAERDLRESLAALAAAHIDDTSGALAHLSGVMLERGDTAQARDTALAARDNALKISGEQSQSAAAAHYIYGATLFASGEAAQAIDEFRASLKSYGALVPPDGMHFYSADARLALGDILAKHRQTRAEGLALLEQGVALLETNLGPQQAHTLRAREIVRKAKDLPVAD